MVADFFVGCSGWGYSDWRGGLYSRRMEFREFLPHYSSRFNFVEVNSSFYKIPESGLVDRWKYATPYDFRFTAKIPKSITHDKMLANFEQELNELYKAFQPLGEKLLAFLIQLPPSLLLGDVTFARLEKLLSSLDKTYCRYAIDIQHYSWFDKSVFELLRKHDVCIVWNQLGAMRTPPAAIAASTPSDFAYIRFAGAPVVGASSICHTESEKGSWDVNKDIRYWLRQYYRYCDKAAYGIFAVENQYSGYAPATAMGFKEQLRRAQRVWKISDKARYDKNQSNLLQFFGHKIGDAL